MRFGCASAEKALTKHPGKITLDSRSAEPPCGVVQTITLTTLTNSMKLPIALFMVLFLATPSPGQSDNPAYDSTLAKRLGADDYGLKKYFLVILKTGAVQMDDKAVKDSLFAGHFNNMNAMVEQKKLIVAGPIAKNEKQYRGIFILDAATPEEVQALLAGDPAVSAKLLEAEIFQWFGSAALPEYLPAADRIWRLKP